MVGMSTALHLKRARPDLSVRLLERSPLSSGGTTRNAGFACFGSAGEWLDDLDTIGPHALEALIRMRAEGLAELIGLLGAEAIGLHWTGGWELLSDSPDDRALAERINGALDLLRDVATPVLSTVLRTIHPTGGEQPALTEDVNRAKALGAAHAIHLPWEGMIHTGRMVSAFHRALDDAGVQRLHGVEVKALAPSPNGWMLDTSAGGLEARRSASAPTGWRPSWSWPHVRPVPNRVLVLRVAPDALPEGTYHIDRGYLYMRTWMSTMSFLVAGGIGGTNCRSRRSATWRWRRNGTRRWSKLHAVG